MQEVRIIPMSKTNETFIGKTSKEVQNDFFMNYLKNEGEYSYHFSGKTGIKANNGDLLLFQFDNHLIASAIFADYDKRNNDMTLEDNSIRIFDSIDKYEFKEYISAFKSFCQMKLKYSLDKVNVDALLKRINY